MNRVRIFLVVFFISTSFIGVSYTAHKKVQSAVTYELTTGRLGNKLLLYSGAKYFSWKHQIPLLYKEFKYSDQFKLHETSVVYKSDITSQFTKVKKLSKFKKDSIKSQSILYVNDMMEGEFVDWDNQEFIAELRREISPRFASNLAIDLPSDSITVAVHVRRGGNYDDMYQTFDEDQSSNALPTRYFADRKFPLKFPNDDYYIEQIKTIAQICPDQKIFVFIFTDDLHPDKIIEKYNKIINNPLITYRCRSGKVDENTNVIDDFFAMGSFDCLIRSDSTYSVMIDYLREYALVFYPKSYYWKETVDNNNNESFKLVIDSVGMTVRKNKLPVLDKNFSSVSAQLLTKYTVVEK